MNFIIKEIRVSLFLIVLFAFLYLIPFNRGILEAYYNFFEGFFQKANIDNYQTLATILNYVLGILALIFYLASAKESNRLVAGILFGFAIYNFGIWDLAEKNINAEEYNANIQKLWLQVSFFLLGTDLIRVRKFSNYTK